jgi:hypothetical protein
MKASLRATLVAATLAAGLALTGCSTAGDTDVIPSPPAERLAAWKDVWVFMLAQDSAAAPSVFFGTEMYPGTYWLDGKTGVGTVQLSARGWVCNDSSASQSATWLPNSMDTYATVAWPNGRSADMGIQNPLLGTPKFYPTLKCASNGPTCGGEASYALDQGDTLKCSTVGFDLTITRNTDTSDFKYFEIVFGSSSAITDDFDFDSPICSKKK